MGRTFNRAPLQFNTPSSGDIKNYFFNHYNWKGVCKDENFLAVDQETFSDAENVYINADGLLRSRPAIKRHKKISETGVLKAWNFGDTFVLLFKTLSKTLELRFFEGQTAKVGLIVDTPDVKLRMVNGYIYIFQKNALSRYDVKTSNILRGKIYIPNTTFDALGVKTSVESKNILTDKERYTYLYDNVNGVSLDVYGKTVSVEIEGTEYSFLFDEYSRDLLTKTVFTIPDGYEEIAVSNINTFAFYSPSVNKVVYSATGISVTSEISTANVQGDIIYGPKFTQDGAYIVIGTTESLFIVSVLSDVSDGSFRFPTFTDVRDYLVGFSDYWEKWRYMRQLFFDFVTYDRLVCVVGDDAQSTSFIFVQDDGVSYTKEIDYYALTGVRYSPYYKLYNDDGTEKVNGLIGLIGANGVYLMDPTTTHEKVLSTTGTPYDLGILYDEISLLTRDGTSLYFCKGVGDYTKDTFHLSNRNYANDIYSIDDILSIDCSKVLRASGEIYYVDTNTSKPFIRSWSVIKPLGFTDHPYYLELSVKVENGVEVPYVDSKKVYSSNFSDTMELIYTKTGDDRFILPEHFATLDAEYLSIGNTLFINSYRENKSGDFEWYLPEINKQTFDYPITNLYPISSKEMGIFFENEMWRCSLSESGYVYTKSRFLYGVKAGGDIIASNDGASIWFCSERGLLQLSYQDFVASSDQILAALSDNIFSEMQEFCKKPVRLFKHGYWLLLYQNDSKRGYVFDTRNGSWWPMSCKKHFSEIFSHDGDILFVSDRLYILDTNDEEYYDDDGVKNKIEWYLTSQKLYFTPNYYKHIINMTFSSVIDNDEDFSFNLDIMNYRKNANAGKPETINYNIDIVRTYVKRLNYFKVNEFQYQLRTDTEKAIQIPLSLSNITIKYKVQGQVR